MSESVQILGAWNTMLESAPSDRMVLDGEQLAKHWRRVSLTSDFWAYYLALHIPVSISPERLNREAMHSVLSYLLNELIENCAKFTAGSIKTVIFEVWRFDDDIVFQITNHIKPERQAPLVDILSELLDGDATELYFQRIEENAESGLSGSGLGYLTLMMDYGVHFGFRFRPINDQSVAIDVQAQVSMIRNDQ